MLGKYFYEHLFTVFFTALALVSCQPNSPVTQDPPTTNASDQYYAFDANPRQATTLTFKADLPDMRFKAEVRNGAGQIVAVLDSGILQTASLTIAPDSGQYQVKVSNLTPDKPGRINVWASPVAPEQSETRTAVRTSEQADTVPIAFANNPVMASACSISTPHPAGVNIRSGPDASYPVIAVMPANSPITADARADSGWYRVQLNGGTGWVLGSVINLSGLCSSLPSMTSTQSQPAAVGGAVIPDMTAPYDLDSYYLGIDRDTGGDFHDAVSYPNGDTTDRILLAVTNFTNTTPRTFVISLTCKGTGTEYLRWGAPENPGLVCGDKISMSFDTSFTQQNFVVLIPGGVGQSYVDYQLHAEPVAPPDQNGYGVALDRDSGAAFSEMISYPEGDPSDFVQFAVPNFDQTPANRYREFYITLDCSGVGTQNVRWGAPDKLVLTCGQSILVPFSTGTNVQNFIIALPDKSGQSYVSYTLRAVPAAMDDGQEFALSVDRDGGGQFNEALSYPEGDHSDRVTMTIANLAQRPPNNYREFNVALMCSGKGVEYVRWGMPENPNLVCGSVITVPFLFDLNHLPLVVKLLDGSPQSYVTYTLVAVAK